MFSNSQLHSITSDTISYSTFFRHAAFRMALRQEVTSAFMKQRSVRLPLEAWASQRSFDEAEDAIWTDRVVLFCADVLQFCFGGEHPGGKTRTEHWKELKDFEIMWAYCKPLSFSPIQDQEPDRSQRQCFPQIWYMSECHVSGMQYLDLARILLAVYDPSIPRLGSGSIAATRRMAAAVREIVLRICGTAMSNRTTQPALVMAHMAIAVCGEYFTEEEEQKGMIELLLELEAEHAWPTAKTVAELKQAWSLHPIPY
jgi:hypothetical protein